MTSRELIEGKGRLFAYYEQYAPGQSICNVLGEYNLVVDDRDQSLTPCLLRDGFWESWITTWLWNTLTPESLFIDVGANCGYYTVLAEKLGADVLAYEPNPVFVRLLEETKHVNNSKFEIVPVALADYEGTVELNIPGDLYGSASIIVDFAERGDAHTVTVDVTTLDNDYDDAQSLRPYILKIDAESAEEMIWNGAQNLLQGERQGIVLIEWTPHAYTPEFVEKIFDWGTVAYINGDGDEVSTDAEWLSSQNDWAMLVIRKR